MTSLINASTSGAGGVIVTSDASGSLDIQSGGTTKLSITSGGVSYVGGTLQVVNTQTGALATGSTQLPWDDTTPQSGEGDQYMTLAITPKSSTSKLFIQVQAFISPSAKDWVTIALFQDSTAGALAAQGIYSNEVNGSMPLLLSHYMTSGTTSSTTFKVRIGSATPVTLSFNGASSARKMGGVMSSFITITEIAQ